MKYKKCPRCELNYIPEEEEYCTICIEELAGISEERCCYVCGKILDDEEENDICRECAERED